MVSRKKYSDKEFIKIYRKMLDWEWYDDIPTKVLFLHLLLRANWRDGRYKGISYKKGQVITSLESLSAETQLTIQQTRTALSKLISTGSVTRSVYPKFSIITIVEWDEYQASNRVSNSESTGKSTGKSTGSATSEQQASNNSSKNIIKKYEEYNKEEIDTGWEPEGGWITPGEEDE